MLWKDACADPATRWRWLVRLRAQGLDARYAEDECTVGGYAWRHGMEMSGDPMLEADPYEGRASLSPFSVTLWPELEDPSADPAGQTIVELDVVASYGGGEIIVDVWRWPDGVDFEEADVLVRGVADAPSMAEDGSITLQCQSFLSLYDRQIPLATCETRLHALVDEDDQGAGYPLLLGAYFRTECPRIDSTTHRHLVAQEFGVHVLSSATYYKDDVAGPALDSQGAAADVDGNAYHYADFTSTTASARITASGDGLIDDAEGTYTETPSVVIRHPADQLRFLARAVCEIPDEYVDAGSFATVRNKLTGWLYGTQVGSSDETSYVTLVESVCKWLRGAQIPERGRISLRLCELDAPPVMTLDETNILSADQIEWGDKSRIVTRVLMRYRWGWHKARKEERYLASIAYGPSDSSALVLAEARYGKRYAKRVELESRYINDDSTAAAAVMRFAQLREKMRRVVHVRCDATTHGLNIFDTVLLGISWVPWWRALDNDPKLMVVTGIQYGLNNNTLTLLEC